MLHAAFVDQNSMCFEADPTPYKVGRQGAVNIPDDESLLAAIINVPENE